jgi:hypothetical protein
MRKINKYFDGQKKGKRYMNDNIGVDNTLTLEFKKHTASFKVLKKSNKISIYSVSTFVPNANGIDAKAREFIIWVFPGIYLFMFIKLCT